MDASQILYDALAYKPPAETAAVDRAGMQVLALGAALLGQGTGLVTAGSERLRSKSLDRNSYNSGEWFNQIRWDCAQGNGFGVGLPAESDNKDTWPYARPLLADPALVPGRVTMDLAEVRYAELLRIRSSSSVFGLRTAEQVQQRVAFPLPGRAEQPGVLTMTLDSRGLGRPWRSVTVVLNAMPEPATNNSPACAGQASGCTQCRAAPPM